LKNCRLSETRDTKEIGVSHIRAARLVILSYFFSGRESKSSSVLRSSSRLSAKGWCIDGVFLAL
ncbi:MAG: hypothetical protein OSB25_12725, partial [Salibacteraceae bacterium]|nr:hypothetical protein [Salibacteraceae bacterium]